MCNTGQDHANLYYPQYASHSFSRVLTVNYYDFGIVYRTNEHAIITDAEDNSKEWLIEIPHFLECGPVNGSYYILLH